MIVETQEQLSKALNAITLATIIAVDTETDGLNTRKNKVIGLGVHTGLSGFYFVHPNHIIQAANALKGKKLLGWNSYFDLEMIRNNFDIDLWDSLYCDVLMLKHTCDEEYPFGLKDVAAKYIGHWVRAEQQDLNESIKKNGGKPGMVWLGETSLVGKYCIQDCKLTRDLYVLFSKQLKADNLEAFFYVDEVMPLYKEVTRFMQSEGIKVDVPALTTAQRDITTDICHLEVEILGKIKHITDKMYDQYLNKHYPVSSSGKFGQECLRLSGAPPLLTKTGKLSASRKYLELHSGSPYIDFLLGNSNLSPGISRLIQTNLYEKDGSPEIFNLNSKTQLKSLFFDILKETAVSHTELGAPQVDEDFLNSIVGKYEWISLLQDYNKLQKLKSSYIDRILEHHEDGTYYPQFKQHGTVSGRYSSDLQQIPRTSDEGQFSKVVTKYRNLIRTFFIASHGFKFIDADYESLEPHIFAHVSQEPAIMEIFERNDDFYSTIAIRTEALKDISANKQAPNYLGKVDKARRQRAKAYSLGIPYGMKDYALGLNLNIPQSEANKLINGYLRAFPRLAEWMEKSEEVALDKLEIATESGRIRHFPQLEKIQEKWDIEELKDSLELWKLYHDDEPKYKEAKKARAILINALNNAKNVQIQGLSASIVNRAAIAVNRKLGILGKVCLNVHDQLVVIIEEKNAEVCREIVQFQMENVMKLRVKLKAPAQIGNNLADAH